MYINDYDYSECLLNGQITWPGNMFLHAITTVMWLCMQKHHRHVIVHVHVVQSCTCIVSGCNEMNACGTHMLVNTVNTNVSKCGLFNAGMMKVLCTGMHGICAFAAVRSTILACMIACDVGMHVMVSADACGYRRPYQRISQ
jgi:hypothetical protein